MGLYSDNFYSWLDARNRQESSSVVMDAQQPFGKSFSTFMGDKFDEKNVVRESKGKENGGQFKTKPKTIEKQDDLSPVQAPSREDEGIKSYTTKAEKDAEGKWIEVKENAKGKSTRNDHDNFGVKTKGKKYLSLPPPKEANPNTPNFDSFKSVPEDSRATISAFDDSEVYRRIAYKGKKSPKDESKFTWAKGGKELSPDECLRLERALQEAGYSKALNPENSDVKVRPDLANPRYQVTSCRSKKGKLISDYGPKFLDATLLRKADRVGSLYRYYDRIKDKIIEDVHDNNPNAWLAYFMMRTKVRIGSRDSTKEGKGARQLKKGNIALSNDGETFYLSFNAKSNQWWHVTAKDKALYDYLKKRKGEMVGPKSNQENIFDVPQAGFRKYLEDISVAITGDDEIVMKPHDFRRLGATKVADEYLQEALEGVDPKKDRDKWEDAICQAVIKAAKHINDTPKVAFQSYILPRVLLKSSKEDLDRYFHALVEEEGEND